MDIKVLEQLDDAIVFHSDFKNGLSLLKRQFEFKRLGYKNSQGVAIFGETGTGKTTLLKALQKAYPNKELETSSERPIIFCTVPPNPTGSSLCSAILKGLGDKFSKTRGTEFDKRDRIINLLNDCNVSVMILDEIQHLSHRWGNVRNEDAANSLKIIADTTNIMIVLSGLEYGSALLKHRELARRFSNNIFLKRFSWTDEDSRKQFKAYLHSLQKQITDIHLIDLTNNKVAFMLYVASGGLPGFIANLLKESIMLAIFDNKKEVGLDEFAEVFPTLHADNHELVNPFTSDLTDINHLLNQAENFCLAEAPKRKSRSAAKKDL